MRMPHRTGVNFQPQYFRDAAFVSANEADSARNGTRIRLPSIVSSSLGRNMPAWLNLANIWVGLLKLCSFCRAVQHDPRRGRCTARVTTPPLPDTSLTIRCSATTAAAVLFLWWHRQSPCITPLPTGHTETTVLTPPPAPTYPHAFPF